MDQLSLDQLDEHWADVEAAVDATPGIDHWCSAPDWSIPVARAFAPRGKRLLLRSGEGNGYALLGWYRRPDGLFLAGIEPLWGFASPVFGPDIPALTAELVDHLLAIDDWFLLALAGLPPLPDPLTRQVVDGLSPIGPSIFVEGMTRRVADLTDGYDAWLAERSSRFRRNLRQAQAKADERGIRIVDATHETDLHQRILDIEHGSWKGADGSGITGAEMSVMYDLMIERLSDRSRLQAFVAHNGSRDVGYILGGIRNRRYRGLQISFADDHADLSIGNLLQDHQLRHLTANDLADTYDMGMDFPYKQRWAPTGFKTVTLVLHRGLGASGLS